MFSHSVILALGLAGIAQSVPLSLDIARDAHALVAAASVPRVALSAVHFGHRARSHSHNQFHVKRSGTYTVVNGDTGDAIAAAQGITFSELDASNPGVTWTDLQIGQILQLPGAGSSASAAAPSSTSAAYSAATTAASYPTAASSAYSSSDPSSASSSSGATASVSASAPASSASDSVGTITSSNKVTSDFAVFAVNDNDGNSSPASTYKLYMGDGSTASGWPAMSDWASFDDMWSGAESVMANSCSQWDVPLNSPSENQAIRKAIEQVAGVSGVDHRFILATIMQESQGCVRVIQTANSVTNPGLMQSYEGIGKCNLNTEAGGSLAVTTPCPDSEILQMVQDGVMGISDAVSSSVFGLNAAGQKGQTGAQAYYNAAVQYNSGSVPANGLLQCGGATSCYASDIANRLTGWSTGLSGCSAADLASSC